MFSGRATDLLRLNSSSALNRYYLALDPVEQFIYMSDPTNFRIIKIDTQTRARDLVHNNFQVITFLKLIISQILYIQYIYILYNQNHLVESKLKSFSEMGSFLLAMFGEG